MRIITTSGYFGCNDTSNFVPIVFKGAAAGYIILKDDDCFQSPVMLEDTSRVSAGNSILSWNWDFGDGQTSSQSGTISHTYTDPGSYTVKLTVKDASGCASSSVPAVAQVTVNGPKAAFAPSGTNVPLNTTVVFSNTSNSYGSQPVWTWDFGDNSSSGDLSPSHTYPQAGTYTVMLKASDPITGCSSVYSVKIVVNSFASDFSASSSFLAQGQCPPMLVKFINNSINYTGVHWDFGDGVVADAINTPSHVYENAGKYTITLTVTGANGLSAQHSEQVIVRQASASFSATAEALCAGQSAQLQASATGASTYTWDFGDGIVSSSSSSSAATHVYANGGNYLVKLLVTDPDGCTLTAHNDLTLDIHAIPVVTITPAQPLICLNNSVNLTATGGSTYSWSPAIGLSQVGIASPVASPVVNTDYQVTVTDDIGCPNTGRVTVTVVQPSSLFVTPDSVAICPGQQATLGATGADQYTWIGDIDGLSDKQSATPIARPGASIVYTVTGIDAHSCPTDTAHVIITVLQDPSVSAGPDMKVQAGNSITLDGTGSNDITQWEWVPSLFLSCADCGQPVCTPKQSVQYILTVKNAGGCVASDTVVVKLECDDAHVAIPDAFTPNGDGHNDRFVIQGISEITHLVIYDRWGQMIFSRDHFNPSDLSSCWDGTLHGQPAPTGVYAYFAEMQCPAGGKFTRRGTVVLVR